VTAAPDTRPAGLLGDTSARDYASKLELFNACAAPELRAAIAGLGLARGMRVLDAGCGSGEALEWLAAGVVPQGRVAGLDLAAAHARVARQRAPANVLVVHADLLQAPFRAAAFDLIWTVNTLHHLRTPRRGVEALRALLRPGGRLVVGQSALVPELLFAWDSRLERLTHSAVRQYYLERYAVDEHEFAGARAVLGLLRQASFERVDVHKHLIERTSPLDPCTERYLTEAIFRDTWGERLRRFLSAEDFARLAQLSDPSHPEFALRRPDFHFVQSFTLATGVLADH
jgi:SAM-dependent methyltransferase